MVEYLRGRGHTDPLSYTFKQLSVWYFTAERVYSRTLADRLVNEVVANAADPNERNKYIKGLLNG